MIVSSFVSGEIVVELVVFGKMKGEEKTPHNTHVVVAAVELVDIGGGNVSRASVAVGYVSLGVVPIPQQPPYKNPRLPFHGLLPHHHDARFTN